MPSTLRIAWTAFCYVASATLMLAVPMAVLLVDPARQDAMFWFGLVLIALLSAIYFPPLWRRFEQKSGKLALLRFGISVIRVVVAPAVLGLGLGLSHLVHRQLSQPSSAATPTSADLLPPVDSE